MGGIVLLPLCYMGDLSTSFSALTFTSAGKGNAHAFSPRQSSPAWRIIFKYFWLTDGTEKPRIQLVQILRSGRVGIQLQAMQNCKDSVTTSAIRFHAVAFHVPTLGGRAGMVKDRIPTAERTIPSTVTAAGTREDRNGQVENTIRKRLALW